MGNTHQSEAPNFETILRVAADAACDPRTAERFLRGERPHGRALAERLALAALRHGVRPASREAGR